MESTHLHPVVDESTVRQQPLSEVLAGIRSSWEQSKKNKKDKRKAKGYREEQEGEVQAYSVAKSAGQYRADLAVPKGQVFKQER